MHSRKYWLGTIVAAAAFTGCSGESSPPAASSRSNAGRVIAIDVLLEPDATMDEKAKAVNSRLRANYPEGYTLGPEQAPHITLVHRYVNEMDLPAIEAAVAKVLAKENPLDWELEAIGIENGIWAGLAITTINVKPRVDLGRLQEAIVKAVEPFEVRGGTSAAFSTNKELPKIDRDIIDYVEKFVPNSSGSKFNPHVTVGVAHEDFVKDLESQPFEKFTFKPSGAAIYQLGNFGTAQKKLWEWKPK